MNTTLRFFLIIVILIYLIIIINFLKRKKLDLKYSLIWLFSSLVLLLLIIFPGIVYAFSDFIGIATPINVVFVVEAIFVLIILLSLTTIVSKLNEQNRKLTQYVALLEKRIRDLEKNKQKNIL